MEWIESFSNLNSTKTDFFEAKVTNYTKAAAFDLQAITALVTTPITPATTRISGLCFFNWKLVLLRKPFMLFTISAFFMII
jgi:hypothetical protein